LTCRRMPGYEMEVRIRSFSISVLVLLFACTALPLHGREPHRKKADYGLGFSTEIQAPESEVRQAVEAVVNDGIIQGSKEYSKDQYIEGATPAASSPLFPAWTEPGKVYYKVRTKALNPRGFYESSDIGTLAVRYVVQSKDATRTSLRIDAVFVEDSRRTAHPSDGSVESAEYGDIQNHLDAAEQQRKQAAENEQQRQEEIARQALEHQNEEGDRQALAAAQASAHDLEQHVEELRRKLERVVKAPGAMLKSAPFHTASSLKSLEAGAEVAILVVTPYWYGVETENGQHGWLRRDELEPLP